MTLRLNGNTSGYTEIDAPAVAGSNTLTLPTSSGSNYKMIRNGATAGSLEFADNITSGTAVASTSGTSIDFTSIPSWVKRITVMFNGVSTSGTAFIWVQIGSGSVETSGYNSVFQGSTSSGTATASFVVGSSAAADVRCGTVVLSTMGSNLWVASSVIGITSATLTQQGGGAKTTSGVLDRIRITTSNGTDTFDAGSINILYE